jgi:hypothetical protein
VGDDFWELFWPIFVIIPGLLFFAGMVALGRSGGPLAIPGAVVTTVGLILLQQAAFERYDTWAYAWALLVVAVGLGLLIFGWWSERPSVRSAGWRVLKVGAVLFVVFGAFFELWLGLGGGAWRDVAWLVLLVLLGVLLLLGPLLRRGRRP